MKLSNLTFPIPFHKTWEIHDASKIQTFLQCPRFYFYRYVLGWETEGSNINLVFGEAWHRAMEYLLLNGYSKEGIAGAYKQFLEYYREFFDEETDLERQPKAPGNALEGLAGYVEEYQATDGDFDVLHTECAGAVMISDRDDLHFRLDAVVKDRRGIFCLEHKTTSWSSSIWAAQWSTKFQIDLYTHVLYMMYPPEQVFGILVNGTIFRKNAVAFDRIPVKKSPAMMNEWMGNCLYILSLIEDNYHRLSKASPADYYLDAFHKNPENCTKYNRTCPYMDLCISWPNPLTRCEETPDYLTTVWWDPVEREKMATTQMNLVKGGR